MDLLPWVEGMEILEWEVMPAEGVCGGSCLYSVGERPGWMVSLSLSPAPQGCSWGPCTLCPPGGASWAQHRAPTLKAHLVAAGTSWFCEREIKQVKLSKYVTAGIGGI